MIRSTLFAIGLIGLYSTVAVGAPIPLGDMSNYAVFSGTGVVFNNNYSTPGTTTINDGLNAGSIYAFGGASAITYNGGGAFQQVTNGGPETTAFFALTSTLSGVGGTAVGSWAGLTPGDYTFNNSNLPTTVTLTTPGQYVFTYNEGSGTLTLSNVNITLGPGVSADEVFWYVPNDFSMVNSTFAGVLVVDNFGARIEANSSPTNFQGRLLAEGTVELSGWNNGNLAFNNPAFDPGDGVPEPSSFVLVVSALAVGAIVKRRKSAR